MLKHPVSRLMRFPSAAALLVLVALAGQFALSGVAPREAVASEELDGPDAALRRDLVIPAEAVAPQRFDVPGGFYALLRHGFDDLRLLDEDGIEVPRLVVGTREHAPSKELAEFSRERTPEGTTRIGVLLDGPGLAPSRLRLVGAKDGPVTVHSGVRPDAMSAAPPAANPERDGDDLVLTLPPSVLRLVRVEAAGLQRVVGEWDPLPGERTEIEPELVHQLVAGSGVELVFDLRVRRATDLVMSVNVRSGDVRRVVAHDGRNPDTKAWRELPATLSKGAVEGSSQIRIRSPGDDVSRWLRVQLRCARPASLRVGRVKATVRAHRVWLDAESGARLRMVVGRFEVPAPTYPLAHSAAHWDAGTAIPVDPVAFAPAVPPQNAVPPPGSSQGTNRPTPWAELIATALSLLLFAAAALGSRKL